MFRIFQIFGTYLMPARLTAARKKFISDMGNLYASYGLNRLNGLLLGLLLASEDPMSLDEICKALNRSKGLISEATRRLHSLGYIKKTEGPESRRDYYTADRDLFINVFHFNMATVRKNLTIADASLQALEGASGSTPRWKENLEYMKKFYEQMNEFYAGFDELWSKKLNP
jgi:DNA-binding transcriptional regulator GbsR (MarR family)